MVLYVLLTWFSALALVVLAELFAFSYLTEPALTASLPQQLADHAVAANPQAFYSLWWVFLLLVGCFIGYTLESRAKITGWVYARLQKVYPAWYQRWHAPRRELSLGLWLAALLLLFNASLLFWIPFGPPYFAGLPVSVGCALGFCISPALRYRKTLLEDRPEQAPQAVLHKLKPDYSNTRALQIGQLYLRLLLPLFMLFLTLVMPLSLKVIILSPTQGSLLLCGLLLGFFSAWKTQPESHFQVSQFRENAYHLTGLLLLSSGLLLFGVTSGNPLELLFFSFWSAYLSGIY